MDKHTVKQYWDEITTTLKQQWTRFSENELVKMKESYQALKGQLQKKYADKKEQAGKELNELKDKREKSEEHNKEKNNKD